jgi:hypothetical protein
MRLVRRCLAAVALTACLAGPAAATPTDRALELTRRYFAASHLDAMVAAKLRTITPGLVQQMTAKNPQLNPQQRNLLKQAASEAEADTARKMVERLTPIFAERFTEKELEEIVAFHESEAGKALTARTPAFAAQMEPTFRSLAPEMLADLNTRFCAKAGCKVKIAPATSPASPSRP